MTKKQGLAGLLLSVFALCSMGSHVLAAPDAQIYPPQALPGEHPELSIEFNVVRDARGKKTGFVELALFAQTPENKAFSMFSTSLEYNSDVLQPVSWTLTPGESGKLTPDQLSADAAALGLNGANVYCGDLPVKGDDNTDGGTAQGGGLPYDGTLLDGTQASFNALYFSAESRNITGVRYPEPTALAVIRMYDTTGKFDTVGPGDDPKVTYDGTPVTSDNVTDFVRFTDDARAKSSPAKQSAWYASADSEFYYVASYKGDPDTLVDVTLNDVPLKAPDTIGRRVLAVDETKTPAEEGYYSYRTNLLDAVLFKVTSKLSYDSGSGTDIGNLATILFYDWDDTLLGTLTVEKGDARAEVNAYVEEHFIHPDLRASTHTGADYTDSTARRYTYRDETYPAEGPGGTIKTPATGDMAGDEYQLTNKLDYSFYKRVTTKTIDDSYPDPDDPSATITATVWTTYPVSEAADAADTDLAIPADAEKYPYVNGWARVTDIKKIADVWTTFQTVGELQNCDPATGGYVTYGDSAYFDLVDFSNLDSGVYYVKACYQEGDNIDPNNDYSIISGDEPKYLRFDNLATTQSGNAYSIKFTYGRVFEGHGVRRTRVPSLRVAYYPDWDGEIKSSYYQEREVANKDVIDVELTPAANVMRMEYVITDGYDLTFVTGGYRSENGNQANILDNFNYNEYPYESGEYLGSKGFVFQATLNQILQVGTEAVLENDAAIFTSVATKSTLQDLNFRFSEDIDITNDAYFGAVQSYLLDAITLAAGNDVMKDGVVDLDWHQLQYHVVHYADGGILSGGKIMTPEECGGFSWCRLDNCKPKIVINITDLSSLLSAAYKAVDGSDLDTQVAAEKALASLTGDFMKSLRLYKAYDPVHDVSIADLTPFANQDVTLVDLLKGLAIEAKNQGVSDPGAITWYQTQHYFLTSEFDMTVDPVDPYWWKTKDDKPVAVDISSVKDLVKAAQQSLDGNDKAWDKLTLDVIHDILRLRKGAEGATLNELEKFNITDLTTAAPTFQKKIETLVALFQDASLDPLQLTWHQVQYYLLTGKVSGNPDIMKDGYWWYELDQRPAATVVDLLQKVVELHDGTDGMNTTKFKEWLTYDVANNIPLRLTASNTLFNSTNIVVLVNRMTQLYEKAVEDGYYNSTSNTLDLTWDQVQYYVITGKLVDKYAAMAPNYSWRPDDLEPIPPVIVSNFATLKAALYLAADGNDSALDTLTTTNLVSGSPMYFRLDPAGTDYQLGEFKTRAVAAVVAARQASVTEAALTWDEVQYYLINGAYPQAGIEEANEIGASTYWWYENGAEVTDLATLLQAAQKANAGRSAGLNTLTANGGLYPFGLRSSKTGGVYAESDLAAFKDDIKKAVAEAGTASLSWNQVQYYIINHRVPVDDDTLTADAALQYWWRYDTAVDITDIASLMQAAWLSRETAHPKAWDALDGDFLLPAALLLHTRDDGVSASRNDLPSYGESGEPTIADFKVRLEALASKAGDNYSTLSWYQVQDFLIETSREEPLADSAIDRDIYWWGASPDRPVLKNPITAQELLEQANINVGTGKLNVMKSWLTANLDKGFTVRASVAGAEYASGTLQTFAVRLVMLQSQAKSKGYLIDGEIQITWDQLQYYLIKNALTTQEVAGAESDKSYTSWRPDDHDAVIRTVAVMDLLEEQPLAELPVECLPTEAPETPPEGPQDQPDELQPEEPSPMPPATEDPTEDLDDPAWDEGTEDPPSTTDEPPKEETPDASTEDPEVVPATSAGGQPEEPPERHPVIEDVEPEGEVGTGDQNTTTPETPQDTEEAQAAPPADTDAGGGADTSADPPPVQTDPPPDSGGGGAPMCRPGVEAKIGDDPPTAISVILSEAKNQTPMCHSPLRSE